MAFAISVKSPLQPEITRDMRMLSSKTSKVRWRSWNRGAWRAFPIAEEVLRNSLGFCFCVMAKKRHWYLSFSYQRYRVGRALEQNPGSIFDALTTLSLILSRQDAMLLEKHDDHRASCFRG